jgi:hypothetical protein
MNSTVHGLRATKVILPNESPAEIQALIDDWTNHYQPTTPGRRALVDRAVMATIHHERSKRYLAATLGDKVRGAVQEFDKQQADVCLHYIQLLPTDPAAAVRELRCTALGCRYLLKEWLALETHLCNGTFGPSRLELTTRLLGHKPEDLTDEVSFTLRFIMLTACEERPPEVIARLLDPRAMPDTLAYLRHRPLPSVEESSEKLAKILQEQVLDYEERARRLRVEVEEPARAAAIEKAMLLKGQDMALWLRYERMHDSMFHRSYNTLERPEARQHDADPGAPGDSKDDDAAAPPGDAPIEENTVSDATASDPMGGPVVTNEGVEERQTKRVEADEPVASDFGAENSSGTKAEGDRTQGDAPEGGAPAIDPATPAAAPVLGPERAPEAEAARLIDSRDLTGALHASHVTALLESPCAASQDPQPPVSPNVPSADADTKVAGCRGDPAAGEPERVDPIVRLWRQYNTPERIAAVQDACRRMAQDQLERKKRNT